MTTNERHIVSPALSDLFFNFQGSSVDDESFDTPAATLARATEFLGWFETAAGDCLRDRDDDAYFVFPTAEELAADFLKRV